MKRLMFFVLLLFFGYLYATPSWEAPTLHNAQLRLDGQLYKRFRLGHLQGSPEFNFPIYLEHNISKYPYEEFEKFSQWTVPQLISQKVVANYVGRSGSCCLVVIIVWKAYFRTLYIRYISKTIL